ncbi:MAG: hypothetical protein ACMVO3_03420 [Thalassobaculum sp.]|jgi:chromosome segregation ATPase
MLKEPEHSTYESSYEVVLERLRLLQAEREDHLSKLEKCDVEIARAKEELGHLKALIHLRRGERTKAVIHEISPRSSASQKVLQQFQKQPYRRLNADLIYRQLSEIGAAPDHKAIRNAIDYMHRKKMVRRVGTGQYVLEGYGAGLIDSNNVED